MKKTVISSEVTKSQQKKHKKQRMLIKRYKNDAKCAPEIVKQKLEFNEGETMTREKKRVTYPSFN